MQGGSGSDGFEPGDPERPPVEHLRPFDSDPMKAPCVNERVNNVTNNDAAMSAPVTDEGEGPGEMF